VMNVVVRPSLVGISICWSIIEAFLYRWGWDLSLGFNTIARKGGHDKATCRKRTTAPDLE
jgi:hypothetical protein